MKSKESFWERILNAYVLIFIIIIFAAILTYIVPAGNFERFVNPETNKTMVDPASFTFTANTPVGLFKVLSSIPSGLINASEIIFFVFIIAGAFEVLNKSGFTIALVGLILQKFKGRDKILFPIIVITLSFLSATIGMAEEVIIFVPILLALSKSLGYDELVAAGLAYCGIRAGHINGMMNPFNVGIAQGFAELPLYSGLGYRTIWCIITIIVTTAIIYRYARKIKKDPRQSLMYGINLEDTENSVDFSSLKHFTATHKVLGLVLLLTFGLTIYGVTTYGWYLKELAALFLGFGLVVGVIARFPANEISDAFLDGSKNILSGALIVGVAGGILVILKEGQIVDSIVYYASSVLEGLPKVLAANGMYVFQWVLNLIIPSGSAQAATTMPIMIPLADVLGINRQVAVTAFHYGDGVTNLLTPACGPLMACLAVAKVPYQKWLKWVLPMLLAWTLIGFAAITVAQLINLGPF